MSPAPAKRCDPRYGDEPQSGSAQEVLLRSQHARHLTPPRQEGDQGFSVGVPQRAHGWATASAKWASIWASRRSVFANCPEDLAKSRTCRGLTTATGSAAVARAATKGVSSPPVDFQYHRVRLQALQLGNQLLDLRFVLETGPRSPGWGERFRQ